MQSKEVLVKEIFPRKRLKESESMDRIGLRSRSIKMEMYLRTPQWMDTRATDIMRNSMKKIEETRSSRALQQLFAAILYNCKDHLVSEICREVYARLIRFFNQQLYCIQTGRCIDTGSFSGIWPSLFRYENRNLE